MFSTNERFLKGDERRGLMDEGKRREERKKVGRVGGRGRVKKKKTEEEGEQANQSDSLLSGARRPNRPNKILYPFFKKFPTRTLCRFDPNQGFDLGQFCPSVVGRLLFPRLLSCFYRRSSSSPFASSSRQTQTSSLSPSAALS